VYLPRWSGGNFSYFQRNTHVTDFAASNTAWRYSEVARENRTFKISFGALCNTNMFVVITSSISLEIADLFNANYVRNLIWRYDRSGSMGYAPKCQMEDHRWGDRMPQHPSSPRIPAWLICVKLAACTIASQPIPDGLHTPRYTHIPVSRIALKLRQSDSSDVHSRETRNELIAMNPENPENLIIPRNRCWLSTHFHTGAREYSTKNIYKYCQKSRERRR